MHEMHSAENLSFWLEAENWKEIRAKGLSFVYSPSCHFPLFNEFV